MAIWNRTRAGQVIDGLIHPDVPFGAHIMSAHNVRERAVTARVNPRLWRRPATYPGHAYRPIAIAWRDRLRVAVDTHREVCAPVAVTGAVCRWGDDGTAVVG
jgi:hypothetical protein